MHINGESLMGQDRAVGGLSIPLKIDSFRIMEKGLGGFNARPSGMEEDTLGGD